jgi:hypothetical protein
MLAVPSRVTCSTLTRELLMEESKSIINETPRKLPREMKETQALVFPSTPFL